MAYREPGVYLELVNNSPLAGSTPNLVPMIIGEGPKYMDFPSRSVVRSDTGNTDVLPSTKVTAIKRIFTLVNGIETTVSAAANYSLTPPNVITWDPAGPAKPLSNTVYYVDYEARPEVLQYEPTYITSFDQLNAAYGGMFMKTISGGAALTVNPLYLGVYLALESGSNGVYAAQVEPTDKDTYGVVISTDIVTALEKASAIENAYFIVPMTSDQTAVGLTINHCVNMSNPLERKERVCFVSKNIASPLSPTGIFTSGELDAVVGVLSGNGNKRARVPFVTKVTKTLSDGAEYTLGAEYVCAALAGLAAVIPVSRALTRQRLYNFTSFKNVTGLRREDKNRIAEAGYIVFEQPGGYGTPATIRHGITSDMSSVANREDSIIRAMDYTSKYVRASLEGYIGTYNIDDKLPTLIAGSVTGAKNTLVRNNIVRDLILNELRQDADNPDSLLLSVGVLPLYPCNYINVELLVE